jgi:hypothetical protein
MGFVSDGFSRGVAETDRGRRSAFLSPRARAVVAYVRPARRRGSIWRSHRRHRTRDTTCNHRPEPSGRVFVIGRPA